MTQELRITKRHLPHWHLEGAAYFVTSRIVQGPLSVTEQKLVLEHLKSGDKKFYTLVAAIIMPDHMHVILISDRGCDLSRIMKGIKGVSARLINRLRGASGSLWQDESYDRIIQTKREFHWTILYMLYNPMKAGLTNNPKDYHGWYYNKEFFTIE